MHEQPPFRHVGVDGVPEHRTPARREIHGVLANVVIPKAVIGRVGHEAVAFLDGEQVFLQLYALQATRAAHTDELQRQVQIGGPIGIRRGGAHTEHPSEPAANVETDDQQPTDVEAGQIRGVVHLGQGRFCRVLDLEDAQVLEPSLDPRKVGELASQQYFGIARGERGTTGVHPLESGAILGNERDE